jgi:hypothetical protein
MDGEEQQERHFFLDNGDTEEEETCLFSLFCVPANLKFCVDDFTSL